MAKLKKGRGRPKKDSAASTLPIFQILQFGRYRLRPWYSSPFPAEYFEGPEPGILYICEICLKYMCSPITFERHVPKCREKYPPGNEIYRKEDLSVFEVNGRYAKEYCQRLCLLAKMFLDHKTLYYDTESFLFYILIKWLPHPDAKSSWQVRDLYSWSFVGYFSKEKVSPSDYNLSCIMTLPHHQRKGYGFFLMDFSYLLSKREGKLGTPEKPLSDLGLVGYVKYWSVVISDVLLEITDARHGQVSPQDIAEKTSMTVNDVFATLEHLKAIVWRSDTNDYRICPSRQLLEAHRQKRNSYLRADPAHLKWVPYTCTR